MDKVVAKKGISVEKENKSYRRRHSSSSSSASTRSRSHSRGHNSRRKTRYQHRRSRTHRRSRSYTRSPSYHRRIRYYGSRENPYKSRVVGIFGLCPTTNEAKLMEIFSPFGTIEHVSIIHDAKTGNSRGFGFIYYAQIDQASLARSNCNGMTLEGKIIRVDYSITKRAHTPTPGIYMGSREPEPRHRSKSRSGHRRRSRRRSGHRRRSYYDSSRYSRSRSRSR